MSNIAVRLANVDDIPTIFEMESECFSDPWELDYFYNLQHNPAVRFLVVCDGETPVGYGIITVIVDECEVLNIAVMPECRRHGIGRILMNEIIFICRNLSVTSVFLEHRESNTPAAGLYSSLGFEEYGRRRRYYDYPTEDAILMKLTL